MLVGAAGDAGYNAAFLKWALDGEGKPPPDAKVGDKETNTGLLFHADGSVELYESSGSFVMRPPYHAEGSGLSVALGAMFAGADAETAARAAIAHDAFCGGEITVLRHKKEE